MSLRTLLLAGTLLASTVTAQGAWPPAGWRVAAPETQGFDSAKLAQGLQGLRDRNSPIHSLLIVRNGAVVLDASFYPYDGQSLHDLASVTKSLMTTLIGIAADQGKLKLDDPLLKFFPGRKIANLDARKRRITVRHLVSMSSGLDCTQGAREETQREMMASRDWVQFSLDRRVVAEPGTRFNYCNPSIHLLSPILQQATGLTALAFARRYLLDPLGIGQAAWDTDPQGYRRGWGDAHLHPHDLAKIGQLWLQGGRWQGQQIVSRDWVENSVKVQMQTGRADNYGYGWWLPTNRPGTFFADGRGGQRIIGLPDLNTVLVTTGGGFDFSEVEALFLGALTAGGKPLPASPSGETRLKATLTSITRAPNPTPVAPLPATARAISGRTYVFGANPLGVKSVRLDFPGGPQARFRLAFSGGLGPREGPVGLDGVYRLSPGWHGIPQGMRGTWQDARTFVLDNNFIGDLEAYTVTLRFGDDRLSMRLVDQAGATDVRLEGRVETP